MKRPILKDLACISQVRLFWDQEWQVALFGQPAQSEDGWIINLPAAELFVGEFSSLPTDTLLAAEWVQETVPVKGPLADLIGPDIEGYSWHARAPKFKNRSYEYADLFRDLALACEEAGSMPLALAFMQKAMELKPKGPAIKAMVREKLSQYAAACQ
jgi:hypothetical protein